ncbi:MAG: hypothetical protein HKN00_06345 [Flavobacteriaceae bacterium]|nr:5'-nucleotidase C-terminal domain-containing protein [Bacteroidia bacterium]NNF74785.1 hypothetical protein [Flavobacteriaceae bacterium]
MTYKQITFVIGLLVLCSCKQENNLTRIEGVRIEINDSLERDMVIDSFIGPYREHVNANLDSIISYAANTYSKTDGELNTAIGNLMADLVYERANPVFFSRTGQNIDMVLLNHGGIRAILSKGPVRTRNAYEIMPFENSIVVAEMKGQYIDSLIAHLLVSKRAHPISRLNLDVSEDFKLIQANINGENISKDRTYYVATNDYLFYGGDRMNFFQKSDSLHVLNYKIRNAMIDYFKTKDTLSPVIDSRFQIIR